MCTRGEQFELTGAACIALHVRAAIRRSSATLGPMSLFVKCRPERRDILSIETGTEGGYACPQEACGDKAGGYPGDVSLPLSFEKGVETVAQLVVSQCFAIDRVA